MSKIGVLALQGAFSEHIQKFRSLGVDAVEVRLPAHLDGVDGLVIPGGESTTIGKLIDRFDLRAPIVEMARQGKPLWGTCAGMILMGTDVDADTRGSAQPLLGLMDLTTRRNAFGRQIDSFETEINMPAVSATPLPAVFIRAPVVSSIGDGVEVLAQLPDGRIVAVRQGNRVATSFHPELTSVTAFHAWFSGLVLQGLASAPATLK